MGERPPDLIMVGPAPGAFDVPQGRAWGAPMARPGRTLINPKKALAAAQADAGG